MSIAHDPTSDDQFTVDLDARGLKSRALMGSAQTAGTQIAKMFIQLGSTLILARLLFPADFGLLAMVYPIVGFIELCGNLGFGQALIQRQELRSRDVSSLFWLNLVIAGGLALVGLAASPIATWIYGEPRVLALMMAISLILPLNALGSIHGALLSRSMRFGTSARNDLIASIIGVSVTLICAFLGLSYWSLVIGQVATVSVGVTLKWASVRWRPARPDISAEVWGYVKFGANLTGANIATFLTSSGDNFIVGVLNGKVALGLYDRSYRLVVQPVSQMIAPIGAVALPLLSRLTSDPDEYRKTYLNFVRIILLLNIPVMLICISNSSEIVSILLGPRWHGATITFAWISVGGLLSGYYSSLMWLFVSQARSGAMLRYTFISAAFNLASFGLGSIWGIEGVAACAAVVFVLITVPIVSYGATISGPVALRDVVLCILPLALTGAAAFLVLEVVARLWVQGAFLKLFTSTILCAFIFFAVSLLLPAERDMMRFAWSKVTRLWLSRSAPSP